MKTENQQPQPQAQRPASEPSPTGKVVVALIIILIGLAVLRGYRSQYLEDAARQPGYEWRHELTISKSH